MTFFGITCPPGLIRDQPVAFIWDRDGLIEDSIKDLKPFSELVYIFRTKSEMIRELGQTRRLSVAIVLSSECTSREVNDFVQTELHPNSMVDCYYLLFPNGEEYDEIWSSRYGSRLKWCGSISEHFLRTIRAACSTAARLRISYYERHAQQYEYQHEIGLANLCAMEIPNMLLLQREYDDEYQKYLDSQ